MSIELYATNYARGYCELLYMRNDIRIYISVKPPKPNSERLTQHDIYDLVYAQTNWEIISNSLHNLVLCGMINIRLMLTKVDPNSHMYVAYKLRGNKLISTDPPKIPRCAIMQEVPRFKWTDLDLTQIKDEDVPGIFMATHGANTYALRTGIFDDEFLKIGDQLETYQKIRDCAFATKVTGIVYLDDGAPCGYLTEYLPRGDLRSYFGYPYESKKRWAMELLDIAVEFEKRGLLRDILKCKHILLDARGHLRIARTTKQKYIYVSQVHSLGKAVLELVSGETPHPWTLVNEEVRHKYPGVIGEIVWKCCGKVPTPTAADVKAHILRAFFRPRCR